jgi:hypothetical protein
MDPEVLSWEAYNECAMIQSENNTAYKWDNNWNEKIFDVNIWQGWPKNGYFTIWNNRKIGDQLERVGAEGKVFIAGLFMPREQIQLIRPM